MSSVDGLDLWIASFPKEKWKERLTELEEERSRIDSLIAQVGGWIAFIESAAGADTGQET